ncbi:MAG: agmatinase [Bacteroidales bacterium]|nr:agmatinase [Bacteroidales bacterium]
MSEWKTFGGIPEKYAEFDRSEILLQSIPYDGTSTWGKGADRGFEAFLEAAGNMELYDIETDSEVYKQGIHLLPEIKEKASPESVYQVVRKQTQHLLSSDKFLTFFGGEHSISIGIMEAYWQAFPGLTVLQLDAHADLREQYLGSPYNHACAMHKASKESNLIQVGIRSMDSCEKQFMDPAKCFFARDMQSGKNWEEASLALMGEQVYLSIDLDVLDPSVMPSTGTPEPGGMHWYEMLGYLKKVFSTKDIVGFDIVEFSPIRDLKAPDFLVAKLYYKLLSYKFHL